MVKRQYFFTKLYIQKRFLYMALLLKVFQQIHLQNKSLY